MKKAKKVIMTEALWDKKVRLARTFYYRGETHRIRVAELAIEACQIGQGGDRDRRFTVVKFAQAIGMNSKTLHCWISAKKYIFDKLPKTQTKNLSWQDIRSVLKVVKHDSNKKEVEHAVLSVKNENPAHKRFTKYIQVLKTIWHNAATPIKLMEIPDHMIEDIISNSKVITNLMERELEYRKKGTNSAKDKALKQIKRFNYNVTESKEHIVK